MAKSDVYYSDLRTGFDNSLLDKLRRLIRKAGIENIDFRNQYAAIKMHFGEPGNLAFLRPNWARCVANEIKALGGKPFLTDCNTLYVGGRKNALDHLESANLNGFNPLSAGCQIIIADGLKGTDDVDVAVNGNYVKNAHIGRAIMDADVFISLTHFKGHESTGFGGALKNIGMGCGSRAGKMDMHSDGKPVVNEEKCIGCKRCEKICAHGAPLFNKRNKCSINPDRCAGCGRCIGVCLADAIERGENNSNEILNCRMMEYAKAVLQDRPSFHISIAIDISPNCDCHGENDAPIVPNVGLFASCDPVALDQACADMVNSMEACTLSMLSEALSHTGDHFHDIHPDTSWQQGLGYAESIGLGKREYNLIKVK